MYGEKYVKFNAAWSRVTILWINKKGIEQFCFN